MISCVFGQVLFHNYEETLNFMLGWDHLKTNHKLSILQTLLTVGCGLVIGLHRSWTLAPFSELLIVALAAAAVCALGALGVERTRKRLQLKPAEPDKGVYAMIAAAGFLFILSAALSFLDPSTGLTLRVIMALFAAVCGAVTLMRLPLRDAGEPAAVYALVPIFYLSFFLLMFYRSNGDNPYLRQYGYEVAVILLLLLSVYSSVCGRFEKPRPLFRTVFCSLGLTFVVQQVVYCALDPMLMYSPSGFGPAAMVMMAAYAPLLCIGLFYPPVQVVFPPKEAKKEASEKEEPPAETEE